MVIGPIVRKELIVASRRRTTYAGRATSVAVLLLVVGTIEACAYSFDWWDRSTIHGQAEFTLRAFGALAGMLLWLSLTISPTEVAPGIATERNKKSLDALLTTRLTGTEVVAGKLAAGLINHAAGLLAGVPLVALLTFAWGIDPRLVLLTYAGIAATSFAAGSMAVWASAHSRNPLRAVAHSFLLIIGWAYLPLLVALLLPIVWPSAARWVAPVSWRLLDTGPISLLAYVVGLKRRGTLVETAVRMIAWETAGGALLVAWTSLRFRAICRAAEDREGRRWLRKLRRMTAVRRPPCGDDPVLWYEKYDTRGVGPLAKRLGQLVVVSMLGVLAVVVYWYAEPAFRELARSGYGAEAGSMSRLELNPFARVLVGIKVPTPALPPGLARVEFNTILRWMTGTLGFLYVIVATSVGSETIVSERARDTLPGLLATPMTGAEILRAKMIGAAWRVRGWAVLVIVLWSLGLLSGAVHPVGFLATLLGLALTTWSCIAIGTYGSLRAADAKQAANVVTLPVTLALFSALAPVIMPAGLTSVFLGVLSPAWHMYLALVSFEDVRDITRPGPYAPLAALGIPSGEGFGAFAATCLVGWTAEAVAASWFTRASLVGFDAAVGRPIRSSPTLPGSPA